MLGRYLDHQRFFLMPVLSTHWLVIKPCIASGVQWRGWHRMLRRVDKRRSKRKCDGMGGDHSAPSTQRTGHLSRPRDHSYARSLQSDFHGRNFSSDTEAASFTPHVSGLSQFSGNIFFGDAAAGKYFSYDATALTANPQWGSGAGAMVDALTSSPVNLRLSFVSGWLESGDGSTARIQSCRRLLRPFTSHLVPLPLSAHLRRPQLGRQCHLC